MDIWLEVNAGEREEHRRSWLSRWPRVASRWAKTCQKCVRFSARDLAALIQGTRVRIVSGSFPDRLLRRNPVPLFLPAVGPASDSAPSDDAKIEVTKPRTESQEDNRMSLRSTMSSSSALQPAYFLHPATTELRPKPTLGRSRQLSGQAIFPCKVKAADWACKDYVVRANSGPELHLFLRLCKLLFCCRPERFCLRIPRDFE